MNPEPDKPPPGYIVPEGDERCGFIMDACHCMKRKGHDGLHACAHGGWLWSFGGRVPGRAASETQTTPADRDEQLIGLGDFDGGEPS